MNRLIYAASDASADLFYATRFLAPDPLLYFTVGSRSHLVLSDLEIDRARGQAKVDCLLSFSQARKEASKNRAHPATFSEICLHILRKYRVRNVTVPWNFPFELGACLRRAGIEVTVPPAGFFPERRRKRPEEIRQIGRALRVTEKLLARAREILRDSKARKGRLWWAGGVLTSERLRAEVQILALRLGAVAENPILAGGVQACDPHHRGSGPLKPGELIIVDLFPQLSETRYWGDMTRTYLKGRASAAQRRLFDTVAKAQKLAMKEIQAGRPGKAVHQRVHRYFTEQGYQTGELNGRRQGFFHGTGHGLGLEIHEAPNLGESGTSKLEKGNVVTVEPGLYYPSIGGVRIEDVVEVTASGCRKLSRFPVELEL